ncbi:hypothetical protein F5Y11DRAFT_320220, partial [Daldinia sp. FL1419]
MRILRQELKPLIEVELNVLEALVLSGRDIKNILKTVSTIAAGAKPLRKHQLQTALDIRKRVDSLGLTTDGVD